MAHQRPGDVAFAQLLHRDLAREGAVGLVEHVLRRHVEFLAQMLAHKQQVEGRRGNDHL
jgi:hypothetical protein